jgi:hypothetical protein
MRYKPKNIDALHIALGGLPNKMRVEADAATGVSAKTVADLRKLTTWPENLVITTTQGTDSPVKISRATTATHWPTRR